MRDGEIRVIKPRIGGGFGSKQEVLIEDVCSALTLKTGKPVLLEYTRAEEFVSSRTRHPMVIKLRTGADAEGKVTAIDLQVLMDSGAYGGHALTVSSNAGSKTLPLYRWNAINFLAETVYTNKPVGGAYRGYGATQAYFPLEVQMDQLAEQLGLDPLEFRRKNHIQEGESSPIFEVLSSSVITVLVASAETSVQVLARHQNQRSSIAGPRPPSSDREKVNRSAMLSATVANKPAMIAMPISENRPIQT